MSESNLTRQVVAWLRTQNVFFWKTADKFTSGIPDLIISKQGQFIAIELKIERGRVSKIQQATLDKIIQSGGKAYVCRTLDEVKHIMR